MAARLHVSLRAALARARPPRLPRAPAPGGPREDPGAHRRAPAAPRREPEERRDGGGTVEAARSAARARCRGEPRARGPAGRSRVAADRARGRPREGGGRGGSQPPDARGARARAPAVRPLRVFPDPPRSARRAHASRESSTGSTRSRAATASCWPATAPRGSACPTISRASRASRRRSTSSTRRAAGKPRALWC